MSENNKEIENNINENEVQPEVIINDNVNQQEEINEGQPEVVININKEQPEVDAKQESDASCQNDNHDINSKDAVRSDGQTRKWNWGAFTFPLFWGIANRVWLCFIVLIPFMRIIWPFILAYKGNDWAFNKYKANGYQGRGKFNYAQKTWNSAGFWAFIIFLALGVLMIIMGLIFLAIYASVVNGSGFYSDWGNGNYQEFDFFQD